MTSALLVLGAIDCVGLVGALAASVIEDTQPPAARPNPEQGRVAGYHGRHRR